jgi:hypothetical protein
MASVPPKSTLVPKANSHWNPARSFISIICAGGIGQAATQGCERQSKPARRGVICNWRHCDDQRSDDKCNAR